MSTTYEVVGSVTAPASPSSSSAPRRIACDRCHGQKLKCPRDVNSGGPCTRCAKAGAICQVSPARQTGRPAKNPKPQHRKSESLISINSLNSSRPSLTESASSIEDDVATYGAHLSSSVHQKSVSTPESYYPAAVVSYLPITNDASKFYAMSDIHFDFDEIVNNNYSNGLGFEYDDGNNFMAFGSQPSSTIASTYSQDTLMPLGYSFGSTQLGVMPPPPTPAIPTPEPCPEIKSILEDSKLERQPSRSSSLVLDYNSHEFSTESLMKTSSSHSSTYSPSLKRAYTMSEDTLPTTTLPIRSIPSGESASKKPRFSKLATCTPEHEQLCTSNLSYSQALSTIQFEVDNFSNSLMTETISSDSNSNINNNIIVDVGVLLPISDKFMALVPQICQRPSTPTPLTKKTRHSSLKQLLKPQLERSHTEPDPTTIENTFAESKSIDSGLVQLIFACQTRLHFAFSVALDIISHNLSTTTSTYTPPNHPSSSIGSYTLPTSSPLSTLLHLHAISHSMDRLDATLHKHLAPDTAPTAGFFEGVFCKQKRNEMAVHAFKERAFEEAGERKDLLMSRIRQIVAEVAGNEDS